ncbi:MAG: methyltransferase domain-containing protein [Candidatus Lokiarchaeota archaeon]|nr:methyltransferase domain-containing protein [Candidatus Lokiarchaeota archaeon]
MKINIGCGKKYDPDYVNIDLYESLVADQLMSAINLTFEDNAVDEIKAIQIIEHLSFFELTYAFSEFYRVLNSGGKLILETPDLKKSCETYINSSNEQKKEVLGWLYGVPHKGLQHKLCYPPFLLTELLKNAGFENITSNYFYNEEAIPTIRFTCNKNNDTNQIGIFQTLSHLRKNIVSQNKVDFTNSFLCKEQEDIISYIGIKLLDMENKGKKELFYNLIIELLIKWPELVNILLSVIKNNILISEVELTNIRSMTAFLIEHNFVNLLYCSIRKGPTNPGTQKLIIYSTELFARNLIKDLLFSKESQGRIKNKLQNIGQECLESDNIIFSPLLIEKKALDFYYIGLKNYHQGKYSQAHNMFLKAIQFNRDNFKFYWYLGKTLVKLESPPHVRKIYKKTLRLLKLTNIRNKEEIEAQIQKEFNLIKSNLNT